MNKNNSSMIWLLVGLTVGFSVFQGYKTYQEEVRKNRKVIKELKDTTKKFRQESIRLLKADKGGKLSPDYARRVNLLPHIPHPVQMSSLDFDFKIIL